MDAQGINALITLAGVVGGVTVFVVIAVKTIKFHRTMKEIGTPCAAPDEMMEKKDDPFDPVNSQSMMFMPGNIYYVEEPKNK